MTSTVEARLLLCERFMAVSILEKDFLLNHGTVFAYISSGSLSPLDFGCSVSAGISMNRRFGVEIWHTTKSGNGYSASAASNAQSGSA
jgi:hypothetical protein